MNISTEGFALVFCSENIIRSKTWFIDEQARLAVKVIMVYFLDTRVSQFRSVENDKRKFEFVKSCERCVLKFKNKNSWNCFTTWIMKKTDLQIFREINTKLIVFMKFQTTKISWNWLVATNYQFFIFTKFFGDFFFLFQYVK